MKKYNLIIDDERDINQIVNCTGDDSYLSHKWDIVRTFDDFCDIINVKGLPDIISFDHDIADFKDGLERSGLTCAKHLVNYCIDNDIDLPVYFVHSANPRGKENIEKYCENFTNLRKSGFFN